MQGLSEMLPGHQTALVLFHVRCWHKQNILFSGQNTELLEHPEFLLLSDKVTVMLHLPDLRVCALGKS